MATCRRSRTSFSTSEPWRRRDRSALEDALRTGHRPGRSRKPRGTAATTGPIALGRRAIRGGLRCRVDRRYRARARSTNRPTRYWPAPKRSTRSSSTRKCTRRRWPTSSTVARESKRGAAAEFRDVLPRRATRSRSRPDERRSGTHAAAGSAGTTNSANTSSTSQPSVSTPTTSRTAIISRSCVTAGRAALLVRARRRLVAARRLPRDPVAAQLASLRPHDDAAAFCTWAGRAVAERSRVPSRRVRNARRRRTPLPWGDAPPGPQHGNFGFRRFDPEPVGSSPAGASAWGVEDLVGNGWEWTSTPFAPFPGLRRWHPIRNIPPTSSTANTTY